MGRPKGALHKPFDDKDIVTIQNYAGLGLSLDHIGSLMGVSKSTMDRRTISDKRVNDALSKGRATAIHNVSNAAYKMAVSGKVPAMTMFFLKCRARWREHREEPTAAETANNVVSAIAVLDGPVKDLLAEIRLHKEKKALK